MDGIVLRYWPKGLGCALALLLLTGLLSFDLQDPTLTNLRLPSGGIANWLALPGALVGGTLLELLGAAALLAPALWLNWVLCARNRPPLHRYAAWSLCVLLALAGLHGLAALQGAPAPQNPGLLTPGLVGWAVWHWAGLTTGPWPAAALLTYVGAVAMPRVVYAPAVHRAVRDAHLFGTWALREGWRRGNEGRVALARQAGQTRQAARAMAGGIAQAIGMGLLALLGLLLAPPRRLVGWLSEWRAPSLAGIKARSADDPAESVAARRAPWAEDGATTEGEGDAFAGWLGRPVERAAAAAGQSPWRTPPPSLPDDLVEDSDVREPTPRAVGDEAWALERPLGNRDAGTGDLGFSGGSNAANAVPPTGAGESDDSAPVGAAPDYTFERPEAEAAWRERFQRYARNLDLDWEEQLWRRQEQEREAESDAPPKRDP